MSTANPAAAPASQGSGKMLRAMVGIGILCALMIVLTYEGTLPRVERLKAEALEQAIFRVIPGATTKQAFVLTDGVLKPVEGEEAEGRLVYAGYDAERRLAGVAIEASGMGYADVIRILYGYDPLDHAVVGFYVLESKETPGLGDKIEKDPVFLANFERLVVTLEPDGETVQHVITTVKSGEKDDPWEIDGITGATISSRAIGDMLGKSTAEWAPLIENNLEVLGEIRTTSEKLKDEQADQ